MFSTEKNRRMHDEYERECEDQATNVLLRRMSLVLFISCIPLSLIAWKLATGYQSETWAFFTTTFMTATVLAEGLGIYSVISMRRREARLSKFMLECPSCKQMIQVSQKWICNACNTSHPIILGEFAQLCRLSWHEDLRGTFMHPCRNCNNEAGTLICPCCDSPIRLFPSEPSPPHREATITNTDQYTKICLKVKENNQVAELTAEKERQQRKERYLQEALDFIADKVDKVEARNQATQKLMANENIDDDVKQWVLSQLKHKATMEIDI